MAHQRGLSIEIADKRFTPDGAALFRDFRLEIAAGSVVALLGPSGIGKSTLLRLVAGIDRELSGRVTVGGVAVGEAPPSGFVFQDPRLLPWLSAIDNVRLADPAMQVEAAVAVLDRGGLAGRGDAYPHQLSGGMQRRIALARALAVNARTLLLDEPFVSLDPALVTEMRQVLAAVIEADRPTVLLVSHSAEDAAVLADRAVVLTGRPVAVALDMPLPTPRSARSPDIVARYTVELSRNIPAAD